MDQQQATLLPICLDSFATGTVSFVLLCMQFARSQLENLGAKPYTGRYKDWRGNRLAKKYPQYNKYIVKSFSEGDNLLGEPIDQ